LIIELDVLNHETKGDKTMNLRQRITLAVATLILALGLLAAMLAPYLAPSMAGNTQAPVQVAGGWCTKGCTQSIPTPPAH
jgi:hypothetical protein